MPGGREQIDAHRDRILDAATTVFAEKGYSAARMDDVVTASGLSKGAVYWHYKSKDGLLGAVFHRLLALMLQKMERVATGQGSAGEGLVAVVRQLTADLRRVSALMPLALDFYAMAARKEWVRRFFQQYYGEYRELVSRLVQAGIDRGEFRPVDLEETAVALTALIEGLILLWTVDRETIDLERHAEAAFVLVLEGLRPRAVP